MVHFSQMLSKQFNSTICPNDADIASGGRQGLNPVDVAAPQRTRGRRGPFQQPEAAKALNTNQGPTGPITT